MFNNEGEKKSIPLCSEDVIARGGTNGETSRKHEGDEGMVWCEHDWRDGSQ